MFDDQVVTLNGRTYRGLPVAIMGTLAAVAFGMGLFDIAFAIARVVIWLFGMVLQ